MQYVDWERENFVRMERFPDYWDFDTQIETISFHQVGEPAVRIAGLRTNEFNIAYSLPPDVIPSLLRDDINVFTGKVQQTETMYLNPRATEPQMDDKRVRQAMQYAIDLDSIHRTILGGYALPVPAGQMTPVGQFGYNPDVQAYPYDPDKARALLEEAGYADGINVSGVSSIGRYFRNQEVLTAMVAQWKRGWDQRRSRLPDLVPVARGAARRGAGCGQRHRDELVRPVPHPHHARESSRLAGPGGEDQWGDRPGQAGGVAP